MSYIPALEVSSSACLTSIDTRSQILSFVMVLILNLTRLIQEKSRKKKKTHGFLGQANKARNIRELTESFLLSYFKLIFQPEMFEYLDFL